MKRPFTTLATAIMCLLAGASVHAGRPGVDPDGEDPACGPTTAHVHRPLAGGPATTEDRRSQPAAPTSIDPFPAGAGLRHTTVAGFDFFPLMDAQAYLKGPSIPMLHGGLLSGTSGAVFEAELDLPHRAQLHRVDILGLQTHAEGALAVSVVERCLPYREGGNPEETLLVSAVIPDQGGRVHRRLSPRPTSGRRRPLFLSRAGQVRRFHRTGPGAGDAAGQGAHRMASGPHLRRWPAVRMRGTRGASGDVPISRTRPWHAPAPGAAGLASRGPRRPGREPGCSPGGRSRGWRGPGCRPRRCWR